MKDNEKQKQWVCYLLHFAQSIDGDKQRAQHYLGTTNNLKRRIAKHSNGTSGARLPVAFFNKGIAFTVVRTWEGGVSKERELKKRNNHPTLCPLCRRERLNNVNANRVRLRRNKVRCEPGSREADQAETAQCTQLEVPVEGDMGL